MVSTGSLSATAASAANATTISMAGQRGRHRRKPANAAMLDEREAERGGGERGEFRPQEGNLLDERPRLGAAEGQAQQRLDLA